jgi:hypothetical protein
MQPLEVRKVTSSESLVKPGDYVFIQKRPPLVRYERKPLEKPKFFQRMFRRNYELKQIVELQWPQHDAIILNCPDCNSPIATTSKHKIISLDPLTTESRQPAPYSPKSFIIME